MLSRGAFAAFLLRTAPKFKRTSNAARISTSCLACEKNSDEEAKKILGSIRSKYQIFRDEDATVILDEMEESLESTSQIFPKPEEEAIHVDDFEGISLERGIYGVIDIEDLVSILRRDKALDIFVARVPPACKYVDYICVCTGKSNRHMQAIAEFVKRVYKKKASTYDLIPIIEGKGSKDWLAMDLGEEKLKKTYSFNFCICLGNIALHIQSSEARKYYGLDSLWAVGPEYDDEYNKPDDPVVQLLAQQLLSLQNLSKERS